MPNYKLTKAACYMTNLSMAVVANISPLLFLTFREMYGLSYTLLGLLVVINFATQLTVDLVFSFFSRRFNINKTIRIMPALACIGLLIYALLPYVFPDFAFIFIVIGTVIFSSSAGLAEVLISPVIAAIPSDNPDREMSKLHSVYAWGVAGVVIVSTFLLALFGYHNWHFMVILWVVLPLLAFIFFILSPLPRMNVAASGEKTRKNYSFGLFLCVALIFLGGASECTMAQWVSGFAERAVGVPKLVGDIFGVTLFAVMLGIGRSAYAKLGKNVINVMLVGMAGAALCYIVSALSPVPVISLAACALTGVCTSMLWPGTLIYAEEKIKGLGVAAYAMLAAGGDMGASVVPQIVGVVTDIFGADAFAMRMGMLAASVFPLLGVILIIFIKKYFREKERQSAEAR